MMYVKLTIPQRDALSQAANVMLAGEEGAGDAAGLSFAVLEQAAKALFQQSKPRKRKPKPDKYDPRDVAILGGDPSL